MCLRLPEGQSLPSGRARSPPAPFPGAASPNGPRYPHILVCSQIMVAWSHGAYKRLDHFMAIGRNIHPASEFFQDAHHDFLVDDIVFSKQQTGLSRCGGYWQGRAWRWRRQDGPCHEGHQAVIQRRLTYWLGEKRSIGSVPSCTGRSAKACNSTSGKAWKRACALIVCAGVSPSISGRRRSSRSTW